MPIREHCIVVFEKKKNILEIANMRVAVCVYGYAAHLSISGSLNEIKSYNKGEREHYG